MSKIKWHKYRVQSGKDFKLATYATAASFKQPEKEELAKLLNEDKDEMASLQNRLYAENRQSLLIILQGMDSAGKDSFIKHIMSDMNPQGLSVHSFKHPSGLEQEHDYLWRHYIYLPAQGQIAIFNRSHYENVLISRVHPDIVLAERLPGIDAVSQVNKSFWQRRYRQICDFENVLIENGTQIVKFFLHLSKEEQRKRFLSRIEEKQKHWKFSSDDIKERGFWGDYQHAYEQAIRHTGSKQSPWYIIPADDKWYAQLTGGAIILDILREMAPKFPPVTKEEQKMMDAAKKELEKNSQ
jgi:PPK2 family polyphosphate:nucleotide phosphotransferase